MQPTNQSDTDLNNGANFDLLSMLNDLDDDNDITNQQMVLAVTQIEQNVTKTAIMKRNQATYPQQTFQNCTSSNIGTLNIHVHKH